MVSITLDNASAIYYHRHPQIQKLRELEEKGKVKLFHFVNMDRDLESLSKPEMRTYAKLRERIFREKDLTLSEHADLCLLAKHKQARRNFFLSLDRDNLLKEENRKLLEEMGIRIREPDKSFLKEIRPMIR
ncbi:MAG: hypothetical protein GTN38_03005 [Candidatus Aenigmarchaeota archaeon]|nr:hypothetical protein [Candidatus Aenigmarchaeota archaeon]NIP40630.1 hypothetical protein [Candidatus Aenigmarchaeota archaeon]NIQ17581.1 hypothetical protein [Candidatus Aenigmarchaeota archaeon]NIS73341.1 hypothetical protein [Candidatus Aenigmarchaeota archaeon]